MIYPDASVVFDLLDGAAPRHAATFLAFTSLTEYGTSRLLPHELLIRPRRNRDLLAEARIERFLADGTDLPMPHEVWDLATDLRADHGLKTPDALHLAIALRHGCTSFWTYDARLARLNVGIPILAP